MAITLIRFIRLFLLGLIVVGLGLLITQRLWVPIVVNFIIAEGTIPVTAIQVTPTSPSALHAQANQEMQSMNASLEGKTGDAFDQTFIKEMIIHHEGAVQMAQLALKNAKHVEIKDLAQKIITAQESEIKVMQSRQNSWYTAAK